MTRDGKIELMAPAGDFERLQPAIDYGTDQFIELLKTRNEKSHKKASIKN